jgi:hypothetical protein
VDTDFPGGNFNNIFEKIENGNELRELLYEIKRRHNELSRIL